MFFESFPQISYPVEIENKTVYKQLVDISTNVRLSDDTLNNVVNYNYRVLVDGETPEITAYETYSDPFEHHLVILANDRYDIAEAYPLTHLEFEKFVNEKYSNPFAIHHFEDVNGNVVDNLFQTSDDGYSYPKNVIPITNYEYESRLNEQRRAVRVIRPEYAATVDGLINDSIDVNV